MREAQLYLFPTQPRYQELRSEFSLRAQIANYRARVIAFIQSLKPSGIKNDAIESFIQQNLTRENYRELLVQVFTREEAERFKEEILDFLGAEMILNINQDTINDHLSLEEPDRKIW